MYDFLFSFGLFQFLSGKFENLIVFSHVAEMSRLVTKTEIFLENYWRLFGLFSQVLMSPTNQFTIIIIFGYL